MSEYSLFESDEISLDNTTISTTEIIRNDTFPLFSANQEHEYRMLREKMRNKTNQQKEIMKQCIEKTKQRTILKEIYEIKSGNSS